jgi:hypothetical protein
MSATTRCEPGQDFKRLLRNSLAALLICATLVALGYYFVDRPVAFYVHRQRFASAALTARPWSRTWIKPNLG